MFQFLIVRIRTHEHTAGGSDPLTFQFLIVRIRTGFGITDAIASSIRFNSS